MERMWWFQPIWTICSSNWIISPGRDENKKYLKPPGRKECGLLMVQKWWLLWVHHPPTHSGCRMQSSPLGMAIRNIFRLWKSQPQPQHLPWLHPGWERFISIQVMLLIWLKIGEPKPHLSPYPIGGLLQIFWTIQQHVIHIEIYEATIWTNHNPRCSYKWIIMDLTPNQARARIPNQVRKRLSIVCTL